ncbi:MAG TPA: NADH-quinone oxidoreductase subunit NuoE [Tenuifilaceae bacterium]|nr:NADH-quinone oxidoreductase subunit NuoE [Tenuifilaceae bacterium]HPE17710.1 NADH-quinone oxidoreductase subunit NuoE [Tenuifilaceae bacterium]HPJ45183.1 NADH-quinone oxidoreductase subunit NuoE [Tenuifilaceae bacterium]HPQ33412.1 NADH-quinone oxidoreductase subunit NuoE [Tenuifilaceae bacterium]HRX66948.1 NADH-quinone oxidoreductase subunit NuoE [Tenuifilaceae bacterium]
MHNPEPIERILQKYPLARRDILIPILQTIQDEVGFLSEEALVKVGKHLKMPTSKIYSLATFYNQFRFQPKGKYHIRVCHGSSCHVMGAVSLIETLEQSLGIKSGQTTRNGLFSLEVVTCMGACSKSPVIEINNKHYSTKSAEDLKKLIENYKAQN